MGSSSSVPSSLSTTSPPPSPPSSPSHFRNGGNNRKNNKEERPRPRYFDAKTKSRCWDKADIVPGRHPERWRRDAAGNIVHRCFDHCDGCLCFQYDHVVPYSKGGESTLDNCQILQTRVNRLKSAQENVDVTKLKGYSCDIEFTDEQLDIIEMGTYGDVIRPGKQCRCKTVAEMLGRYKSKDDRPAC